MQKVHSLRTHRSRDRHALCSVGKCSENFQHLPGTPLGIPSSRGVKNKKETFLQATNPQLPFLGIWLFWLRLGELKKTLVQWYQCFFTEFCNVHTLLYKRRLYSILKAETFQIWQEALRRPDHLSNTLFLFNWLSYFIWVYRSSSALCVIVFSFVFSFMLQIFIVFLLFTCT